MKTAIILTFSALFYIPSVFAGNTFEGNMIITTENGGKAAGKMTLAVKNDLIAINPGSGPQSILNVSTGDFLTVINQGGQKMVMKMNIALLGDLGELPSFMGPFAGYIGKTGKEAGTSEVEVANETKVVNGFKCKKYTIKDKDAITTIWATQDVPFSLANLFDLLKAPNGQHQGLKSSFPVQASVKDLKTNEVSNYDIKVEKKSLEANLFEVPKEYMVMDMTPLIQQMFQSGDPAQIKSILDQFLPK